MRRDSSQISSTGHLDEDSTNDDWINKNSPLTNGNLTSRHNNNYNSFEHQ